MLNIWRSTTFLQKGGNMQVASFGSGGEHQKLGRSFIKKKMSLAYDLRLHESPGSANHPKNVVIVMDGMEEFTTEPLKWALENVILPGCVVTLVGVMPWLNIPLSSKTWLDVWMLQFEDLPSVNEKSELRSDVKYLKLQAVAELCKNYGVVPQKKVVMGYPSRLLVVEQITSLHATWVVFDRHHRKNREFYAKKIPCNMVMMNEEGGVDMIRGLPMIDSGESTPGESPASVPTPKVIISKKLNEILKERAQENQDEESGRGFLVDANALRDTG